MFGLTYPFLEGGGSKAQRLKKIYRPRAIFNIPGPPCSNHLTMSLSSPDNAPLFAERPEWADVQPLDQYEDANPIAPIFYTEECECLIGTTPRRRFIEQ